MRMRSVDARAKRRSGMCREERERARIRVGLLKCVLLVADSR
jgi:hypothetical protein